MIRHTSTLVSNSSSMYYASYIEYLSPEGKLLSTSLVADEHLMCLFPLTSGQWLVKWDSAKEDTLFGLQSEDLRVLVLGEVLSQLALQLYGTCMGMFWSSHKDSWTGYAAAYHQSLRLITSLGL